MYTAVLERTREIGILKSMGASKLTIVGVVLRETAVMAVVGVVLGIAATFGIKVLIAHLFPTQHFEFTAVWVAKGAGIAFMGAMLRRALSGVDGGAERPNRGAGLRISTCGAAGGACAPLSWLLSLFTDSRSLGWLRTGLGHSAPWYKNLSI